MDDSDAYQGDIFDDDEFREYSELLHRTYVAAAIMRPISGARASSSLHSDFESRDIDDIGTEASTSSQIKPEVAYFADVARDDDSAPTSFISQDTRDMLTMARAKIDDHNASFPGREWMDNPESPTRVDDSRDRKVSGSGSGHDRGHSPTTSGAAAIDHQQIGQDIEWVDASLSHDDTSDMWFSDV